MKLMNPYLDVIVDPVEEFVYDYGPTIAVLGVLLVAAVIVTVIILLKRKK